MPIGIRDVGDGRGNIITGSGFITEQEYVDAFRAHLGQDVRKFKKYRYSICDYTAVTGTDISSQAVVLVAKLCKSAAAANPDAVIAIAANEDLIYGLSRMFQVMVDETKWELKVFRSKEDAVAWTQEKVQRKYDIDDLLVK